MRNDGEKAGEDVARLHDVEVIKTISRRKKPRRGSLGLMLLQQAESFRKRFGDDISCDKLKQHSFQGPELVPLFQSNA